MLLPCGKPPARLLSNLLASARPFPPEVLLGPAVGEDACAIDVPAGVLVVSTDPITLTGKDVGRFAVTVNANDVAVTGVRPRWFLAAVLLPPGTTEAEVESLFSEMHAGVSQSGVALVGGHTEITNAVNQPVVVGQMLGLAEDRRFVETGGVRAGHVVFQVGRAPVEGAAVLAREGGGRLADVEPAHVRAAEVALHTPGISVVNAALLAARLGATAMHDPTEGGLAAGLHEMAAASGVRLRLDRTRVLWWEPAVALCLAAGADPWATLASGTLLAAFPASEAGGVASALSAAGHQAAVIAIAEEGAGVIDTDGNPLVWPARDEISRLFEGGN
jgi:hydrogenase expression/formation protein HypE